MAASASRVRIAYRESGSSDPWKIMRRTGDALTIANSTVRSDEIRSDRTRGDQKTITLNPNGTIDSELSAVNFDDFMAASLGGTWASDSVQNGVSIPRYDFLKSYLDIDEHVLFEDCVIGQMQVTANSAQKVTTQLTIMGEGHDDEYDPSGDTFVEPEDTIIMDTSNNLGQIQVDGAALAGTCFTAISFTINGNFQSDQCIGTLYQHHTEASLDITGSATLRYTPASMDVWRKTTTSTPLSLGFVLSDEDYSYAPSLPRVFVSGDLPNGAVDGGVLTHELAFTAARDVNGVMMSIDRTVPAEAP